MSLFKLYQRLRVTATLKKHHANLQAILKGSVDYARELLKRWLELEPTETTVSMCVGQSAGRSREA